MVVGKIFGSIDLIAAGLIGFGGFAFLGMFKWLIIAILVYKGVISFIPAT